ncbi:hypothetical protein HYW42_01505 [Candidatus Daviesbacteria bacterium]|nr:hypothetical protein [Candidatus Daviesbacteria bacterium]
MDKGKEGPSTGRESFVSHAWSSLRRVFRGRAAAIPVESGEVIPAGSGLAQMIGLYPEGYSRQGLEYSLRVLLPGLRQVVEKNVLGVSDEERKVAQTGLVSGDPKQIETLVTILARELKQGSRSRIRWESPSKLSPRNIAQLCDQLTRYTKELQRMQKDQSDSEGVEKILQGLRDEGMSLDPKNPTSQK